MLGRHFSPGSHRGLRPDIHFTFQAHRSSSEVDYGRMLGGDVGDGEPISKESGDRVAFHNDPVGHVDQEGGG